MLLTHRGLLAAMKVIMPYMLDTPLTSTICSTSGRSLRAQHAQLCECPLFQVRSHFSREPVLPPRRFVAQRVGFEKHMSSGQYYWARPFIRVGVGLG